MTLRKKTLFVISVALIALLALLYVTGSAIWLDSFSDLEKQITDQNVKRAVNALSDNLMTLQAVTGDYAEWDDTYAFVEDHNPAYIEANFFDDNFVDLHVNLMLVFDSAGQLVYAKNVDLQTGQENPVPLELQAFLKQDDPLLQHADTTSQLSGLILLPDAPLLVSSRPILTSLDEGPIRGSFIMARFLDAAEVKRLAGLTDLSLTLQRFDAALLPDDFQRAREALSAGAAVFIQPLSANTVGGYALLRDFYNQPALILRVDLPRHIYAQGQASLRYFAWSLLVVGLVFGLITLWLLEKLVLSRLARLSAGVSRIGAQGQLSARVDVAGNDELSSLAGEINDMLEALEQTQHELQAAKKSAEAANQAKSTFLASMSHELRTPLNAIIGYSEMLQEEVEDIGQADLIPDLRKINEAGQHLLSLLNEVLDLSKIEAGKMELHLEAITITDLVREVVVIAEPLALRKGNQLIVRQAENLGSMHSDAVKLRQSLLNLLSNAAKFTENGTITLTVAQENSESSGTAPIANFAQVVFSVADTGIGLTADQIERLFQPFTQAEASTNRKYGGTGLGLVITRHFCHMLGGEVTVISDGVPGRGAIFTLRLPVDSRAEAG